jgi:hypothetical protein
VWCDAIAVLPLLNARLRGANSDDNVVSVLDIGIAPAFRPLYFSVGFFSFVLVSVPLFSLFFVLLCCFLLSCRALFCVALF